ncbi:acyl carrier protein [Mycolicibacterium moriokaense]|nr:acyl carrier protein [Mycolicibacterium moriokaense]
MGKLNEAFGRPPNEAVRQRCSATDLEDHSRTAVSDGVAALASDVERDIVDYLRAHHGVEADELTDDSTLEDLGLDSLGVLAIGDILERKYGISLDDERFAGVRTFSDFKKFVFLERTRRPSRGQ